MEEGGDAPTCNCGNPAILRTCGPATRNPGRKFWACASREGCQPKKFFQWADEGPRMPTYGGHNRPRTEYGAARQKYSPKRPPSPPHYTPGDAQQGDRPVAYAEADSQDTQSAGGPPILEENPQKRQKTTGTMTTTIGGTSLSGASTGELSSLLGVVITTTAKATEAMKLQEALMHRLECCVRAMEDHAKESTRDVSKEDAQPQH